MPYSATVRTILAHDCIRIHVSESYLIVEQGALSLYIHKLPGGSCFRGPRVKDYPRSWMTTFTACFSQ